MSYLVLARKYRPQRFDEVVGQEHVSRTLANAILAGRVAHAILFSGPRGTGKTTIARILAKAMNCFEAREVPNPTPCNLCRSCKEITAGSAVDVFEIDGASNNSVDQVRELRENIRYMPAHSRYKIYIIDEVHMLSTAAFNALLKTLEEPPAHVMFLFATTEPSKIPITILSRCQRHDLRRIDLVRISDHMKALCLKEEMEIEEKSLSLIARESGGSMRDALSLLDQVMSCTTSPIGHDQVLNILGIIDRKVIFDISGALFGADLSALLTIVENVYSRGHDIKKLYSTLIEHLRNLLIAKMGENLENLLNIPAHERELMKVQVHSVSETYLAQILNLLFKEEQIIRFSSRPRLALEMAFIKIIRTRPALSMDHLIEKIDSLRNEILVNPPSRADRIPSSQERGGAAFGPVGATSGNPPQRQAPAAATGTNPYSRRPPSVERPVHSDNGRPARNMGQVATGMGEEPHSGLPDGQGTRPRGASPAAVRGPAPGTARGPAPAAAHGPPPHGPADYRAHEPQGFRAPGSAEGGAPQRGEVKRKESLLGRVEPYNRSGNLASEWTRLVNAVGKNNRVLGSCLAKSTLKKVTNQSIEVELSGSDFNIDHIKRPKNFTILTEVCCEFFRNRVKVGLIENRSQEADINRKKSQSSRLEQEARNHPMVTHAVEVLGGKIEDIKIFKEEKL